MSLKDLEKYQENGYRTGIYFEYPNQQETKAQELVRLMRIKQNRQRVLPNTIKPMTKKERDIEHALWEFESEKENFYDNDLQLDYYVNY